jgi:hypothetical protein
MNFDRIRSTIDVDRMRTSHAVIVGGAYGLAQDLVRCGLGAVTYIDFDRVTATNPARQDFNSTELGQFKAEAIASSLRRINPEVEVNCLMRDFCELSQEEMDEHLGQAHLIILATDFFPAQARGNLEALRVGKPALWIGLYRQGRAGEIVYHVPGITSACYRCACAIRYAAFGAHGRGTSDGGRGWGVAGAPATQIPSDGGTIFDLHLVDAIAGQIAVGILTSGSDNRMGRLIRQLGNRNFLQVKSDPDYRLGDRDIFREYLGHNPANFSFNTIALPMEHDLDCPDCALHRRAETMEPSAG